MLREEQARATAYDVSQASACIQSCASAAASVRAKSETYSFTLHVQLIEQIARQLESVGILTDRCPVRFNLLSCVL